MIDGQANTVYEQDTVAEPADPMINPHLNGYYPVSEPIRNEQEAARDADPLRARTWQIVNPSVTNAMGQPVAYKLVPGEKVQPFAHPGAPVMQRADFIRKPFRVTAYDPAEQFAAGDYINQHRGGDGLPAYQAQGRDLEDTDVVVWYTVGHHHIPRPEDWPVMPVLSAGFALRPVGFFDGNPAMDVPPPDSRQSCESH